MDSTQDRTWALTCSEPQALWQPTDRLMLGANAVMFFVATLSAHTSSERLAFGVAHVLVVVLAFVLANADRAAARRGAVVAFCHDWFPALFTLALFFELSQVIPRIHPYAEHPYDSWLQALDVQLLGDPARFMSQLGPRWLADVLALCYAAYYPFTVSVPAILYVRKAQQPFRQAAIIIMSAFMLTYVGYALVPAVGPHLLFDGPRADVLNGYGFARYAYSLLLGVPFEPPDAFPSGHTLMAVLVPVLAWRWCRPLFGLLVLVGIGIVAATIYLRYHYIADVLAAFVLAPVAWRMGIVLDRRYAGPSAATRKVGRAD